MSKLASMAAIRVCVAGVTGWTGRAVAAAVATADDLELVSGVSRSDPASYSSVAEALDAAPADVLVDYTHPEVVRKTSSPPSGGASRSSWGRAGSRRRTRRRSTRGRASTESA
jgi:hypothetical protein